MNVNKILERNRFTALCGGCGEIFHYSTIGEVVSAHQDGPNCETLCPSCLSGVLCACEHCQSIITDELKSVTPSASHSSKVIIKDCKECDLSSDSCNCVCLDLAAAPAQVVPTPTGSQRPIPAVIAELLDFEGFNPLTCFADFGKLVELTYRLEIDYHAVITRVYAITTPEIPFSELTVHQIVSAIYAAAEEQSK